jgi:hypothetical protein
MYFTVCENIKWSISAWRAEGMGGRIRRTEMFKMATAQKKVETFIKKWEKANAECKKAFEKYQTACAGYHWTGADAGWKWKKVLALRDKYNAAWEKAEAALEKLAAPK